MLTLENIKKHKELILVTIILVFALIIRNIYSTMYFVDGDLVGHMMASMRLSLTSPFETGNLLYNSFAQLLQFNHGYTTMLLPFLFYTVLFNFLRINISENSLVFANSLLGILSLISIYLFTKVHFTKKIGIYTLILISIVPVHIGLSRAHVGTQIIQSIFFFLSLYFLKMYFDEKKYSYKLLYFMSTFFLIGSDNLFFVSLFLQLVYIYFVLSNNNFKIFISSLKIIYLNILTLLFIILPITAYIFVTIYSLNSGIESGFLLRLLSKGDIPTQFNLLFPLRFIAAIIGPIVLLFIMSLFKFRKIMSSKVSIFLLIQFFIYYVFMSLKSGYVEMNYVMFFLVPIVAIGINFISELKRFRIVFFIFALATLLLSLSVVYGLNIGLETPYNFGSVNKLTYADNDYGVKALGYLVRERIIPVSVENVDKHGFSAEQLNMYIAFESAYYYLGDKYVKNASDLSSYDEYFLAVISDWDKNGNNQSEEIANNLNMSIYGYIGDGNNIFVTIYSSKDYGQTSYFYKEVENKLFDEKYNTMEMILNNRINIGHY